MLKKILYFSICFASLTNLSTILCMEKIEKAHEDTGLQASNMNFKDALPPFVISQDYPEESCQMMILDQNTLCYNVLYPIEETELETASFNNTYHNIYQSLYICQNIINNPSSLIDAFKENTHEILSISKYTQNSALERIFTGHIDKSDFENNFYNAIFTAKNYFLKNPSENSKSFFKLIFETIGTERENFNKFKEGVNFIGTLTKDTISLQNLPECLNYINHENCKKYFFYIRNCPIFSHLKNILSSQSYLTLMFIYNRPELLDIDKETKTCRLERIINFKMQPNDLNNPAAKAIMAAYLIFKKDNTPDFCVFKNIIEQQIKQLSFTW